MLEASFKVNSSTRSLAENLLDLPAVLRPTHFNIDEVPLLQTQAIGGKGKDRTFLHRYPSGIFLAGKKARYHLTSTDHHASCFATLSVESDAAKKLLPHISILQPSFGYMCTPEERVRRNMLFARIQNDSVEAWVGRDISKYLPGLYWQTLLSDSMMARYGISLSDLSDVATNILEPTKGLYIIQFYDQPDDWLAASRVDDLIRSIPGIFSIDELKPDFGKINKFEDALVFLRHWR